MELFGRSFVGPKTSKVFVIFWFFSERIGQKGKCGICNGFSRYRIISKTIGRPPTARPIYGFTVDTRIAKSTGGLTLPDRPSSALCDGVISPLHDMQGI